VHYVAALAIALTAALNYVGVRWSAVILNLTTSAKYGALVLLVLLAFLSGRGDVAHFTAAAGPVSGGLFGLALVSVLWAYDGWGDLSFVGGEVRDPERNLPRALVLGTSGIIAIYLLVNAAYLYLLPLAQVAHSPLVAADAAQLLVGRVGVGLIALVVMISTFSTLLGSMLTAPRIFFAMADDGLFFRSVARVHPRFQTPSASIVLTGLLGIGFVLARTFEQLADQFVVAIFPFYALAAAAVFVLRRRRPEAVRPVRVFGYPAVPLLFVLASLLILGNALIEHPMGTGLAFLIILLGIPVYYLWLRVRGTRGPPSPEP
jgi:amino acid transporter